MKLDIVLISYNQEQYIAQAVESILMQRVKDDVQVQIIVADDCSKDKTLEIIKSYEGKSPFPFVYLPIEQNMGHVRNYQRAFAVCEGDYIAILEGDDWWTNPKHLQIQIDYLLEHNECVLTTTTPLTYNEQEGYNNGQYNGTVDYVTIYTLRSLLNENHIINMSAIMIRNNVLKKITNDVYTVSLLDWLLYILLSEHGVLSRLKINTSVYRVGVGLWENDFQQKGIDRIIEEYDTVLKHKYHNELVKHLSYQKKKKKSWKSIIKMYIPPIFVELYRLLIPNILKSK